MAAISVIIGNILATEADLKICLHQKIDEIFQDNLCISDAEVIALDKWVAKYLPPRGVYSVSAVRDAVKNAMEKDDIDYNAIYELRCIFGYTAMFDRQEDLPFSEAVIDTELVCRIKALMQSETISFELTAVKLGCTPANIAANYEV